MKREHLWMHFEQDAPRWWHLAEGGYASSMSVRQGETVTLHISNSRSYYDVHVYYEGATRRLMHTIDNLRGQLQSVPEHGYRDGFDWQPTCELRIAVDWPSGVYIAEFATAQGPREVLFVVRPRTPREDAILLTIETNTYHAYNPVGGRCFFPYLSRDREHSNLISTQRPLTPDLMGGFHAWDQFFTSWLDAEGYTVDYCTNADHDNEPDLLDPYRAHLRIGHGEYTSRNECEQLQAFVARGGNLAVFAGNSIWHLTETRGGGNQIYSNKSRYAADPLGPGTSFLCAIDNLRQRTIGVSYTCCVNGKTKTPGVFEAPTSGEFGFFRATDAAHWAFTGTGLQHGDEFGRADSIVGVECDGGDVTFENDLPRFTGSDGVSPHYRIIALADAAGGFLNQDLGLTHDRYYCTMTVNETEHAGNVFVAPTIEWAHGLYRDHSPVAQITRNVLDRFTT